MNLLRFAALSLVLFNAVTAQAAVLLTVEGPGIVSSQVSSIATENFDSKTIGFYSSLSTDVGQFNAPGLAVAAANRFGGAGGTGNFVVVGRASGTLATTLTLAGGTPQAYLGFWWSAADAGNAFDVYSGATLLGSFDPAAVLDSLSIAYNGNPTGPFAGQVLTEKYAYINLFGNGGTTFDRVVFRNASLFSGFEIDNLSIRREEVANPSGTPVIGGITNAVPEPSTIVLMSIGALGSFFGRTRSTRRKSTT